MDMFIENSCTFDKGQIALLNIILNRVPKSKMSKLLIKDILVKLHNLNKSNSLILMANGSNNKNALVSKSFHAVYFLQLKYNIELLLHH